MNKARHSSSRIIVIGLVAAVISILPVSCIKRSDQGIVPVDTTFNYPSPPAEGEEKYFPVAENGQPRCVVVYPKDAPGIQRTAEALRAYLERVTGAPIKLILDSAPAPEGLAQIHVGATGVATNTPLALPDLQYGPDTFPNVNGYLVKTVDARTLVIRGRTPCATEHGVVGFLRRYVGIRQYWEGSMGSLGEVVPSRPTLFIPQVEWRDWPFVYSRWISQMPFTPERGALDFFRRNVTLPCCENYFVLLPPKIYAKTHPEYFPFRGGRRQVPRDDENGAWQPCVANPDVARIMAEAVKDYFRKHPESVALNVAVNDGAGHCECAACQAMDAPNTPYARRMSDRYIKFTNRICEDVEREFPSKYIVFLAYGGPAYPPVGVKPHRMILLVVDTVGQNTFEDWDNWLAAGLAHMGIYFNHNDLLYFILPKYDVHQLARRIRYATNSGRLRLGYIETYPHWPLSGLVSYIAAELFWDPRQDVDALLAEFYASFFGPAAKPMGCFYGILDAGYEAWLAKNGLPYKAGVDIGSTTGGRSVKQFSVLSLDQARQAAAALREAADRAAGDPLIIQRVEAVHRMFRLVESCVETYWTADRLNRESVTSEAEARAVLERARRLFALSHAASEHIATVLDKTPPELYGAVFSRPGNSWTLELYESLKTGKPGPESIAAIKKGADAIGAWLHVARGQDAAVRWWDDVIAAESVPDLAGIFKMARLASGAGELKTIYRSQFDEAGRKLAPPDLDIQAGDQAIVIDQFMESGRTNNYLGGRALQDAQFYVYAWFPDRTPFTLAMTRKDTPGNVFVLMAKNISRAKLGAHTIMPPGARHFRAGFLFKRNSEPGHYTAEIVCNVGQHPDIKQITVATLTIPEEPGVWHEVAASVETPEQTSHMFVNIFVNNQAAGAKCWVGNVFISEYVK